MESIPIVCRNAKKNIFNWLTPHAAGPSISEFDQRNNLKIKSKIDPETVKIWVSGAGLLEVPGKMFVEIFGELAAKISPRWTQDGPSWQQVAPKMGHDGAKMAISAAFWGVLGPLVVTFSAIFAKMAEV